MCRLGSFLTYCLFLTGLLPSSARLKATVTTGRLLETEPVPYEPFTNGTKILFMGHSFFIPAARRMNELISYYRGLPGAADLYPNHDHADIFAGGGMGAPGNLWQTHYDEGYEYLSTGEFDVLAMTGYLVESEFEDYQQWIDLAIQFNPNITIFVGVPYAPLAPVLGPRVHSRQNENDAADGFPMIESLRSNYADTQIIYYNYGKVASLVFDGHVNQGGVHGISKVVGKNSATSLFLDIYPGHAGELIVEVNAIMLLHALYGADLERTVANLPPEYQILAPRILDWLQTTATSNLPFLPGY